MRPPLSSRNRDVSCRLDFRLSEVIHLDEQPLATFELAGRVYLDDAPDRVRRSRNVGGDALGGRERGSALERDCGLPFRRQGDPVMAEVRAIGKKGHHSGFPNKWGAIIERKRAVVCPETRHGVYVATICERSVVR